MGLGEFSGVSEGDELEVGLDSGTEDGIGSKLGEGVELAEGVVIGDGFTDGKGD